MASATDIKNQLKNEIERVESGAPRSLTLRERLEQPAQQAEFAKALGKSMSPMKFARMIQTAVQGNSMLQECDWKSVVACGMVAAQLSLEPNSPLGHAYIVPFRNNKKGIVEAQFILGYKGIVELAHRSEHVLSVQARVVRTGDEFTWEYGTNASLVHRPLLGNKEDPIAYYCVANFTKGGHYFVVVSPDEIEEHRQQSKQPDSGPWKNNYSQMAMKTTVRMAAPYLPLTSTAAAALEADETTPDYDTMVGNPIDVGGREAAAPIDIPENQEVVDPQSVCETCGALGGTHEDECPERSF